MLRGISLQKLEVFHQVVRSGSVTRAAEALNVSQPVVTAHLRSLEEKLGVRLVTQKGRTIALTAAGERVAAWADSLLIRTRELERELDGLTDGQSGSAIIAASMTAGTYTLPDLLAEFGRDHPGSDLRVTVSDPRIATTAVRQGGCDFAVLILDPSQGADDLQVEPLWDEPLVLCAAAGFRPADRPLDAAALADLTFVTSPEGQVRREKEDELLQRAGLARGRVSVQLGHPEAMKRAVLAGMGASFLLLSSVREELETGRLVRLPLDTPPMHIPLFLVHRRSKVFSPLQERLMARVRAAYRAERDRPVP